MVRRQSVSKGDILVWWPPGQNAPDYHLMVECEGADSVSDYWSSILLNTGEQEEVNISDANVINWWPHESTEG